MGPEWILPTVLCVLQYTISPAIQQSHTFRSESYNLNGFFFTTPCFDRGGQLCFLDVVLCQQQFFLFIVVFYCSVLMLTHTVVISQKKGAKQKKIVLESGSAQLYPKFFPGEKWYLEEYLVVLGLNSTKYKYYKIFFFATMTSTEETPKIFIVLYYFFLLRHSVYVNLL